MPENIEEKKTTLTTANRLPHLCDHQIVIESNVSKINQKNTVSGPGTGLI